MLLLVRRGFRVQQPEKRRSLLRCGGGLKTSTIVRSRIAVPYYQVEGAQLVEEIALRKDEEHAR